MARYTTPIVAALATMILGAQAACARRSPVAVAPGRDIQIPDGLDSAQKQAWIARQRASCSGRLVMLVDIRVFAVRCLADSASTRHPPNQRRS